jgi:hypothetical protein
MGQSVGLLASEDPDHRRVAALALRQVQGAGECGSFAGEMDHDFGIYRASLVLLVGCMAMRPLYIPTGRYLATRLDETEVVISERRR